VALPNAYKPTYDLRMASNYDLQNIELLFNSHSDFASFLGEK